MNNQSVGTYIAIAFLVLGNLFLGLAFYRYYLDAEFLRTELETADAQKLVGTYQNKAVRSLQEQVVDLEERIQELEGQLQAAQESLETTEAQLTQQRDINAGRESEMARLQEELTQMRQSKEKAEETIRELQEEIQQPDEALARLRRELDEAKLAREEMKQKLLQTKEGWEAAQKNWRGNERELTNRIVRLEEALNEIRQGAEASRDVRATEQHDGKILEVDVDRRFGVINLGEVHRVKRGMRFDVMRWRYGTWEKMGKVEVTKVYPSTSTVTIVRAVQQKLICPMTGWVGEPGMLYSPYAATGEGNDKVVRLIGGEVVEEDSMDPLDPILPGDYISNPFYSRDKSYTFTLAGEMELFSREELTNLIQEYGGSVAPEVGIKTDFLVLGEVPDRSQATSEEQKRRLEEIERVQKLAKQYGVPVMREVELVELFKY